MTAELLGGAVLLLLLRALIYACRQLWLSLGAEARMRREDRALAVRLQSASLGRRSTSR